MTGLIFIMGLGISWTCLLAMTAFGVFNVYSGLNNGNFESTNTFENLYSLDGNSKRKRMLSKKREKYEKRRTSSQDGASSDVFQDPECSVIEDYDGVFANSFTTASDQVRQRSIPSLRSPQPLLSAFNTRIARR